MCELIGVTNSNGIKRFGSPAFIVQFTAIYLSVIERYLETITHIEYFRLVQSSDAYSDFPFSSIATRKSIESIMFGKFRILYVTTQLLGVIVVALTVLWVVKYMGVVGDVTDIELYNWHSIFMVLGMVFFYGNCEFNDVTFVIVILSCFNFQRFWSFVPSEMLQSCW